MSASRAALGARGLAALIATALVVVGPSACRSDGASSSTDETSLVVFAASSLREVFTELAGNFERVHPGVKVTFNFAGTQELRTQLEHGAVADVLASADQRHMEVLVRANRVATPVVFARNELVIVVAARAAEKVKGLADLPSLERIVVGAPEVPVGRYSQQLFARAAQHLGADYPARVEAKIVSRELNVRQVLAKVSLGEAEAGLVYGADVRTARGVVTRTLPPELAVVAEYPIAVVEGAAHPKLARVWVDLVTSAEGQRVLGAAGFVTQTSTRAQSPSDRR